MKYIAESGPSTYTQLARGLGLESSSIQRMIRNHLKPLNLVQRFSKGKGPYGSMIERCDGWWITLPGLILALDEGAEPVKVRARILETKAPNVFAALCEMKAELGNLPPRELLLYDMINRLAKIESNVKYAKDPKFGPPLNYPKWMTDILEP
ncbi:MAG: hypothetical protein ABSB53_02905 [Nitrososphaerales archaeon]